MSKTVPIEGFEVRVKGSSMPRIREIEVKDFNEDKLIIHLATNSTHQTTNESDYNITLRGLELKILKVTSPVTIEVELP